MFETVPDREAEVAPATGADVGPSLKLQIAAAVVVIALVYWGRPYWLPWLAAKVNAAVQTSAQTCL